MKLLIVGGVAGGASAAARARCLSEDADIVLFERGPDVSFLDVRTAPESISGHIPGSVNIHMDELRHRLPELPRDRDVAVYCQVGQRGYLVTRILRQAGCPASNIGGGYKTYLLHRPPEAGRVRMVFVADMILPELRRIVEFLNGQMDAAEVLAVEIKQYKGPSAGQKLKTLVPRSSAKLPRPNGSKVAKGLKRSNGTRPASSRTCGSGGAIRRSRSPAQSSRRRRKARPASGEARAANSALFIPCWTSGVRAISSCPSGPTVGLRSQSGGSRPGSRSRARRSGWSCGTGSIRSRASNDRPTPLPAARRSRSLRSPSRGRSGNS